MVAFLCMLPALDCGFARAAATLITSHTTTPLIGLPPRQWPVVGSREPICLLWARRLAVTARPDHEYVPIIISRSALVSKLKFCFCRYYVPLNQPSKVFYCFKTNLPSLLRQHLHV